MPTPMPPFETDVFVNGDPLVVATVAGYTVAVFVDDVTLAALREDIAADPTWVRRHPGVAQAVADGTVYWWFVYRPDGARVADSAEIDEYGNYFGVPDALADAVVYAYRQACVAADHDLT